jgi:GNAT superfamily N-acetyltransferase
MSDHVFDPQAALAAVGRALPDGVSIRRLKADDLEAAQALSREFQWPHRVEDWQFALAHGQGAAAVRDGELVGTAVCWPWGKRCATLGLVLVSTRMQGQRVGQHLMHAAMAGLEDRTVLLHATPEGRGLYERMGFVITGEVRQHQNLAAPAPLVALPQGERLRPLGRNDAPALVALDARAAGMPREAMLRQLLAEGDTVVLARGGEAIGFSIVRRFGRGHAIGPVVAPDLASAQALIGHSGPTSATRRRCASSRPGSRRRDMADTLPAARGAVLGRRRCGPVRLRGGAAARACRGAHGRAGHRARHGRVREHAVLSLHRDMPQYLRQQQRWANGSRCRCARPSQRGASACWAWARWGRPCWRSCGWLGFDCAGWSRSRHATSPACAAMRARRSWASLPGPHRHPGLPAAADARDARLPRPALFDDAAAGACLVHVGRGPHLVEADLLEALASGPHRRRRARRDRPRAAAAGHPSGAIRASGSRRTSPA